MDRLDYGLFLFTFIDSFSKHIECAYYVSTICQVVKRASEADLGHGIQIKSAQRMIFKKIEPKFVWVPLPSSYCYLFFFFFASSRAAPVAYGSSQVRGSNRSCSRGPMPQPQQRQIQAASATYTTGHGNARSLTH